MKQCTICGEVKPLTEYHKKKDGLAPSCKPCRNAAQRARKSDWHVKKKFGITRVEYDQRKEAQGNRCGICGKHEDEMGHNLHLDHDHDEDTEPDKVDPGFTHHGLDDRHGQNDA